ncbi:hypothetical protein [Marinomonas communis]|uniref:hypothetical protein n=1 Tax=Marinomonas communis TaxID=28254 RepID=UPI0013C310F7|nr:hypothetical protein [Marinomonas communis]
MAKIQQLILEATLKNNVVGGIWPSDDKKLWGQYCDCRLPAKVIRELPHQADI